MQKKKNLRLLGVLLVLILAITALEIFEKDPGKLGIDKKVFQLDPEVEINAVTLTGPQETTRFNYSDGIWHLNDSLILDQSMRDVFFSVVSQIEIRRPVLQSRADSIVNILLQNGIETTISFGGDVLLHYWISGNRQQQVSWIMGEDKQPYQVHIPGYQSFVAGIYSVPQEDWRSRFLLNVNFGLIRTITLDYPNNNDDLKLKYQNGFYQLSNQNADSTKIANFLEQISFLQVDQFLSPDEAKIIRQEFSETSSIADLRFDLVNGSSSTIRFVSLENDKVKIYALLDDGSLASMDQQRLKELFKTTADFE